MSGSITISGSSTVEPISSVVAEVFNADNPDVQISVDGPGTGDGFELFCKGETDISDASRPIEDEEAKACQKAGIEYTELEIGLDGVTVMTNPENADVTCLNFGDLYALFGPESDGIDTWNGADSLASRSAATAGSPMPRWRSRRPERSPGPTTPSSSSRGSKTPRSRRACPRTRPPRSAATTSPRRTTT